MSTTGRTDQNPLYLRVFLASPGDVAEERKLALEVLERLPDDPAFRDRIMIRTIAWDKPGAGIPMLATMTPQETIAKGLTPPSECDIVLVILWSRLGTPLPKAWKKPDGSLYHSGTEWEYYNALEAAEQHGKPKLLLYRRTEKVLVDLDDPALEEKSRQWRLVKEFFAALRNPDGSIRGGCNEYKNPLRFREDLNLHLRSLIQEILARTEPAFKPVDIEPVSVPKIPVQELQKQTAQKLKVEVVFHDTLKDDHPGPKVVVIPSGEFMMGSPEGESGREESEGPQHKVVIVKPFAMGCYAVSFEEYDRFCEATGRQKPDDRGWGRGQRPVINVSWKDAVTYCTWLSQETGATYRLPSEAEWEYAARAGTTTTFWWSNYIDTTRANYNGNFTYRNEPKGEDRRQTVPVDTFQPNPLGLYQMHGNVWEWLQDIWHHTYENAPVDGSAWVEKGDGRCVLRGGAWDSDPRWVRGAARLATQPPDKWPSLGFRLARTLP